MMLRQSAGQPRTRIFPQTHEHAEGDLRKTVTTDLNKKTNFQNLKNKPTLKCNL